MFHSIYHETRSIDDTPLKGPLDNGQGELTPQQMKLADEVYHKYHIFDGLKLMLDTHEKGTPWHDVNIVRNLVNGRIPNHLVKDYYKRLLNVQPAA